MRYRLLPLVLLLTACQAVLPDGDPQATENEPLVVHWEVTAAEDGPYDMPRQNLALVFSGAMDDRVELGTYAGTFADSREVPSLTQPGALMSGSFWWAGAGDEFKVTVEGDKLMVERRGVDEMTRDGAFETHLMREIPGGTSVVAGPWEVEEE